MQSLLLPTSAAIQSPLLTTATAMQSLLLDPDRRRDPVCYPRRSRAGVSMRLRHGSNDAKEGADPKKRVVITGMGLVSVFGNEVDAYYDRLLAGESGVGSNDRFDASKFPHAVRRPEPGVSSEAYTDGKNERRRTASSAARRRSSPLTSRTAASPWTRNGLVVQKNGELIGTQMRAQNWNRNHSDSYVNERWLNRELRQKKKSDSTGTIGRSKGASLTASRQQQISVAVVTGFVR